MVCDFDFARVKNFVEKKSHRLLLREAMQRAEAPDQIHRVNADNGRSADM
jgi:hypothetical protein